MVQLFAEQRPTILRDTDDEGNNILHNLAELSIKHPERAIKCLKIILKTFPRELIRDVLMEAKNFNGLTALEQAVLKGSPLYFTLLLETRGFLKSLSVIISGKYVYSNCMTTVDNLDNTSVMSQQTGQTNSDDDDDNYHDLTTEKKKLFASSYTLFHYDVTKYERGNVVGDNSFLLTILTRRDLTAMSDAEVESIAASPLLAQWMHIKSKSMITIRNLQFIMGNVLVLISAIFAATLSDSDSIERLIISFWSTVEKLATTNSTIAGLHSLSTIISNGSGIILDSSINSALEVMNLACGFDVSLYIPNINSTTIEIIDNPLVYYWLIAGSITVVSIFTILSDLYLRLVFITRNYFYSGWKSGYFKHHLMIRRVFARPMQVSYVDRQLSVLSAISWIFLLICVIQSRLILAVDVHSAIIKSILRTMDMMFALTFFSTRFFTLLYSLRAKTTLNVAGRFILTMCKMFSFIVEFS